MMNRRQWLGLGLGAAAAGCGAAVAWHQQAASHGGSDAPAGMWALRFERPEGGELAMASLRGRPLLINFWATWCAPCIKELPEIDRFSQRFREQQGQVLGLAIDAPAPVREFLGRVKLGFPTALGGLDGTDLIHQLGNLQGGLPFSVLIDGKGRIAQRKMGETSFNELLGWAKAL